MKETENTREKLHMIALKAPQKSGVYLWKDKEGIVIYVGKAINLKNRLSSYFAGHKDIKTRLLVSHADYIEYITTENEYEALILENNLIKQYSPKFNINLKDDKSYPMLRITAEPFPRVFKTRRLLNDGSLFYGPFPNIPALDNFIAMIEKYYKLRKCRRLAARPAPCLYYHIGRCSAPCCGKIAPDAYRALVTEIVSLLDSSGAGKKVTEPDGSSTAADQTGIYNGAAIPSDRKALKKLSADIPTNCAENQMERLTTIMKKAAAELRFEEAARLRDGILAVKELQEQNVVQDFNPEDRDYIAYASEGTLVSFIVMKMRDGRLVGRDLYRVRSLDDEEDLLPDFLLSYYEDSESIPPSIFVPSAKGMSLTRQWFAENVKKTPAIKTPQDKHSRAVIAMANLNAKEDIIRRIRERGDFPALQELQQLLSLSSLPSRIEGFDIAHINGRLPVASLVSFKDGNPDKKQYRYFRLKTTEGIIDDFASMREAVSRRYTRLLNEQSELPDLILIDGGPGQISAVSSVLTALHLDIPIAGLAKRDEEIWLPGKTEPIRLPRRSDALRLLQRVRDETHRFATSRNQRLRTKENVVTVFESLPGIGKTRALKLMRAFTTLEDFCAAAPETIATAASIPREAAKNVLKAAVKLLKEREETIRSRKSIDTGGYQLSKEDILEQEHYFAGSAESDITSDNTIADLAHSALRLPPEKTESEGSSSK